MGTPALPVAAWTPAPARPLLDGGEVHVWRAELDTPGWPSIESLPADERARARRRRAAQSRARWVAARWALRLVLARYVGGDPADVALRARPDGKPELAEEGATLCFNLSHSGAFALVALASAREVGVDIERLEGRRDPLVLADRWLGSDAAAAVRAASPARRAEAFHAAWTRHEATRKCTGAGLSGPQPEEDMLWIADLAPGEGYAAAVALERARPAVVRTWVIEPPARGAAGGRDAGR